MKRQYPRIRCNDIVNNSQHYGNCLSDHWINAVLKVQHDPSLCRRCDLREPVPTKLSRVQKCRSIIYEMEHKVKPVMKAPKLKQLKLQFEMINDELPF